MKNREEAGIGPAPLEMTVDVDAVEQRAQGLCRESAHPLIEVAQNHFRAVDAMIVNVRGEPRRLVAPFEHGGAEMHVVDMQDAALAEIEIGALTRPRLAGAPRQVGTGCDARWGSGSARRCRTGDAGDGGPRSSPSPCRPPRQSLRPVRLQPVRPRSLPAAPRRRHRCRAGPRRCGAVRYGDPCRGSGECCRSRF